MDWLGWCRTSEKLELDCPGDGETGLEARWTKEPAQKKIPGSANEFNCCTALIISVTIF